MDITGKRIKELRTERELSMAELIQDIKLHYPDMKIDKSMLSRWERGENDPSLENAKYLSLYFDVSLDYLIGLTNNSMPHDKMEKRIKAYAEGLSNIMNDNEN